MPQTLSAQPSWSRDLTAGLVVFLVALPFCLGIAITSNAPPVSGILAGIIGGILVGWLSGSSTSVSGPSAGMTAVVALYIAELGSFEAFLLAVVLGGIIQLLLGVLRFGFIASFFPSAVVKGVLAAIGVIVVLKQIPHLFGHDIDPMGDKSFFQPDGQNTFTEIMSTLGDLHPGSIIIGFIGLAIMFGWNRVPVLTRLRTPSALIVIIVALIVGWILDRVGGAFVVEASHRVAVPAHNGPTWLFSSAFSSPDWSFLSQPLIYKVALTVALVATLETLLNIEAVDILDPRQRTTPRNRELMAQGAGNILSGLIGGLPITSIVLRSSVNINAGATTKRATMAHGFWLLAFVAFVPELLNRIPLAALAAILIYTASKLFNLGVVRKLFSEGPAQFVPFVATVLGSVFTDLLGGVVIGLAFSVGFILNSNARRPVRKILEKHVSGDVLHIELANQVSFFGRAALDETLRSQPAGSHLLLNASNTDYIDPDVLDLIEDFRDKTAPALGINLSLTGFKKNYPQLDDRIQFMDYTSREVQKDVTPAQVLQYFKDGNERFLSGRRIHRDPSRIVGATATGQFPMAVVLGCIDSRTPAELVFDLGLGDIFSARIAGNIATEGLLGSMEYACAVAGAKLVVVMGHTSCGAVNAAVDLLVAAKRASEATPCVNLDALIGEIQMSVDPVRITNFNDWRPEEKRAYANDVARRNVLHTMGQIRQRSSTLDKLVLEGKMAIVGCLYDVSTGKVDFFQTHATAVQPLPAELAAIA